MIPDIFAPFVDWLMKPDSLVHFSIGTAAVSSALLHQRVPKIGPGRAITLALRSVFHSGPAFASVRTRDKSVLLSMLNVLKQDQFIVCKGPRGIGKTHMIRDALTRTPGVVYVNISPGTTDVGIVQQAYAAISNTAVGATLVNPEVGSRRVLWWYRLLFRRSPIVVISAKERTAALVKAGVQLAAVPGAARELASAGFRVIVDASENSIAPDLTLREEILHLSPLPFEVRVRLSHFCRIWLIHPAHIHAFLILLL